ncbi:unnamed protein product [Trichobilharzia regenti]|nr:unnamed protein product [Trichobilharzia regenti]
MSPGSKRLDAPILWFYLNWTNLHTGQMETVRLSADQRTYYLSNLTCATTVKFQLKAENKVGNSSLTDVTSWTTLGSGKLLIHSLFFSCYISCLCLLHCCYLDVVVLPCCLWAVGE